MYQTPKHLMEPKLKERERVPVLGVGFMKSKLDARLHARLLEHFTSNVHHFKSEPANDYLLTENSRAYPSLLYMDETFNRWLLAELQAAHEAWCGRQLRQAACYGIRVYQPKSYLYNHIDHIHTHVVSSTICVDHRLADPWPLHIEDLDGTPHEVDIDPGEMVFFEGARLIHGRPYPLNGEYYANIFAHYTPLDWDLASQQPDHGTL